MVFGSLYSYRYFFVIYFGSNLQVISSRNTLYRNSTVTYLHTAKKLLATGTTASFSGLSSVTTVVMG